MREEREDREVRGRREESQRVRKMRRGEEIGRPAEVEGVETGRQGDRGMRKEGDNSKTWSRRRRKRRRKDGGNERDLEREACVQSQR